MQRQRQSRCRCTSQLHHEIVITGREEGWSVHQKRKGRASVAAGVPSTHTHIHKLTLLMGSDRKRASCESREKDEGFLSPSFALSLSPSHSLVIPRMLSVTAREIRERDSLEFIFSLSFSLSHREMSRLVRSQSLSRVCVCVSYVLHLLPLVRPRTSASAGIPQSLSLPFCPDGEGGESGEKG